ncbi:MAG: glutathione S-transferase N-terminal domain-containing protein [Silicimonas sp.]|jgi:GST-like protein|nr:glutathione S-transferase N-terminal domain-containing protein [Silicimonas sp.]
MIDLYSWTTPNGRKVSIALEEMGIDYEPHAIDIGKGQQFTPEFLAISPNNKIPAIVERETGFHLMESGAILLWLSEKCGKFMPDDRWQAMEWLMWQMGGFGPMLGQAHHFLRYNPEKSDYASERYGNEARRLYRVLDRHLQGRDFMVGDYSIVDMATWPWASRFEWQQIDLTEFPNVCDWYLRIADRPAVQRGYDVPKFVNPIPRP